MTTTRESYILTFMTNLQRNRTLRIPDPSDVSTSSFVGHANEIIASSVFAPDSLQGVPTMLREAHKERVVTTTLIG